MRSMRIAAGLAARGRRLLRRRGELLEPSFTHVYDTGAMRRTHLRGHSISGALQFLIPNSHFLIPKGPAQKGDRHRRVGRKVLGRCLYADALAVSDLFQRGEERRVVVSSTLRGKTRPSGLAMCRCRMWAPARPMMAGSSFSLER